ncbi:MAG: PfkB family carbohydrate kinase [Gordonia sp. (in: high G+C Gram-positive bacteria)]
MPTLPESSPVPVAAVGTLNLDQVIHVPRLPADGETVRGTSSSERPGGKGANQARAAARVTATALVGAVGADAAGTLMLTDLRRAGVRTEHVLTVDEPSGRAVIEVDEVGTNRIIALGGANGRLDPPAALAALDHLDPAVVLTQLESPPPVTRAVANWAVAHRRRFLLNPSPVAPLPNAILDAADPLIVNEIEAHFYGNAGRSRIVTLDARGILVIDDDGEHPIPVEEVPTTDTTGAGDTGAGTLAAHLADGSDLLTAATRAASAATAFVASKGY